MTEFVLAGFGSLRTGLGRFRSIWTAIVAIPLLVLVLDPDHLGQVLDIASGAFLGTLPYIVIAVALIAYLKASGAESMVARAFEGRETRMILVAALIGGLAPFCSCEVIPFIAGLLAVGAPLSAVMAFWLSSPLIDPPTLFITAGALGWEYAIGKTVAAVALGLLGGLAIKAFISSGAFTDPLRPRPTSGCGSSCGSSLGNEKPVWQFWKEAERRSVYATEFQANALFLVKWLAFAYLLEALLILYVPAEAIGRIVGGDGLLPIALGAVVGAPAYLNGYAAPALVAGLMEQGMSAGAAMAFMVAGAVSSVPAMAAVWSLVKPQVFASYLLLGITGAIGAGVVFAAIV